LDERRLEGRQVCVWRQCSRFPARGKGVGKPGPVEDVARLKVGDVLEDKLLGRSPR